MLHSNRLLSVSQILSAVFSVVYAQQDAGQAVTNSLPIVPGATTKYFNIKANDGSDLTLVNYFSWNEDYTEQDKSLIKRAVIVVHGQDNDPQSYEDAILSALADVPSPLSDTINRDSVAVIAPGFFNVERNNGLISDDNAGSNALVWSTWEWFSGGNSIYPSNTSTVSSYDVMDQIIQYFDDKSVYPNMQKIIISGHSMGAQLVNRYAAVGKDLQTSAPLVYYIADPNDYLWFSDTRPNSTSDCSSYNDWNDGVANYANYNTYNGALAAEGVESVQTAYNSRVLAYARATRDMGDYSENCNPYSQGDNRYTRFFNFIAEFPVTNDVDSCSSSGTCNTIDYIVAGHDDDVVFASDAGRARLFTDGFDGAAQAYDFYYPRFQSGDDPFPDPSQS